MDPFKITRSEVPYKFIAVIAAVKYFAVNIQGYCKKNDRNQNNAGSQPDRDPPYPMHDKFLPNILSLWLYAELNEKSNPRKLFRKTSNSDLRLQKMENWLIMRQIVLCICKKTVVLEKFLRCQSE